MSKLFQAFLSGIFFTFIMDFFIFLGIQINYIDFYDIDLYYNILFADNQNIFVFLFFTVFIGALITYVKNIKISLYIIIILSLLSLSTLIKPVGYKVAQMMFMKKGQTLKNSNYTFHGDIYYNGRDKITFFDYQLKRIITLNKKDLQQ